MYHYIARYEVLFTRNTNAESEDKNFIPVLSTYWPVRMMAGSQENCDSPNNVAGSTTKLVFDICYTAARIKFVEHLAHFLCLIEHSWLFEIFAKYPKTITVFFKQ